MWFWGHVVWKSWWWNIFGEFAVRFLVITWGLPCANKCLQSVVVWNVSGGTTLQNVGMRDFDQLLGAENIHEYSIKTCFNKNLLLSQLLFSPISESGINHILPYCLWFVHAVPFPWVTPSQYTPPPTPAKKNTHTKTPKSQPPQHLHGSCNYIHQDFSLFTCPMVLSQSSQTELTFLPFVLFNPT